MTTFYKEREGLLLAERAWSLETLHCPVFKGSLVFPSLFAPDYMKNLGIVSSP